MKRIFISGIFAYLLLCVPSAWADDNNNTSIIDQIGANNDAEAIQGGNSNTNISQIDQAFNGGGDILTAFVEQGGASNGNEASVAQGGLNQYADILQGGGGNLNFANVTQDGTNNEAFVTQQGTGNNNHTEITQHGTGALNSVVVTQEGSSNFNSAAVSQNGSSLVAATTQK